MLSEANIQLVGHLTKDAVPIGQKGAGGVGIAINDAKDHTSFYELIIPPKTFENIGNRLTKGTPVSVFGKPTIKTREYQGKRYTNVNVLVNFLGIFGQDSSGQQPRGLPPGAPEPDDDIPF